MSETMRVALVIGDLNVGGAQKQSYYIAKTLKAAGVDIRVYYTNNGSPRFEELRQMDIPTIWFGRRKNPLGRTLDLTRFLGAFNPHIALCTRTYNNLYLGVAGRLAGIKTVGTLRNSVPYERAAFPRLFRLICTLPNAVAVNSYLAEEQLRALGWLADQRVQVLLNVIDLDEFDAQAAPVPQLEVPPGTRNVFFVGRLVQQKRLDWLLMAFAQALEQEPALRLFLVGDGDKRELVEQIAADLDIQDKVVLLGKRSDVPALLKHHATMLALVSEEEGFPNVVMEAMAAGKPIVATRAGDSGRIVDDGETGFLVDIGDVNRIAEGIARLGRSPELAASMGAKGRAKVEQQYAATHFAERILEVFYKVHPTLRKLLEKVV